MNFQPISIAETEKNYESYERCCGGLSVQEKQSLEQKAKYREEQCYCIAKEEGLDDIDIADMIKYLRRNMYNMMMAHETCAYYVSEFSGKHITPFQLSEEDNITSKGWRERRDETLEQKQEYYKKLRLKWLDN